MTGGIVDDGTKKKKGKPQWNFKEGDYEFYWICCICYHKKQVFSNTVFEGIPI